MADSYFDRFERQLVAAEARLAPERRRRWRWLTRPGAIIPIAISLVTVPALAATQPWDELSGAAGSHTLQAEAPVPAAGSASTDAAPAVGVITYASRGGLACLAAGPIENGRVGRYGRTGDFRAFDASEAPGPCGDLRENLQQLGGIALAHSSSSKLDPDVPQGILYGLVGERSTTVRVTWADQRTENAAVRPIASPEEMQGAEGTFVLAAQPGERLSGARVELLRPDGSVMHVFEF